MADTKISGATAVTTSVGTDEYATNQGGASKRTTLAQVKTFTNTAPVFAAGTASANTWPKFTSGTLLTTPEAGAIELDSNCFYGTTDAGNRGYVPVRHFIRLNATRTLPNDTNENQIFTSPTNGRLTLETGTYLFEGLLVTTATMSATSGNASIDILGAGTATIDDWLWQAWGIDQGTIEATGNRTGSFSFTQQSAASIVNAATGNSMGVQMYGTFTVTSAGTIIPSIDLVTAAAVVLRIGTHMIFERIGDTSVISVGQWD